MLGLLSRVCGLPAAARDTAIDDTDAGCEPQEAISAFTNMQQLWTDLKDGLALKMLAGLRQIAGLSPPPGLLALPAELRTKILANLQVSINPSNAYMYHVLQASSCKHFLPSCAVHTH